MSVYDVLPTTSYPELLAKLAVLTRISKEHTMLRSVVYETIVKERGPHSGKPMFFVRAVTPVSDSPVDSTFVDMIRGLDAGWCEGVKWGIAVAGEDEDDDADEDDIDEDDERLGKP